MAVKETPLVGSLNLFIASKQIQFLKTLKRIRFSGQLVVTDRKSQQWIFYLYLGSIIYATGGNHQVRRWQRNLGAYCPQIPTQGMAWQRDLAGLNAAFNTCWEYQLLGLWIKREKIAPQQAANIIRAVVTEVLFDVGQAVDATSQIKQDNSFSAPLVSINVPEAIAVAHQHWQAWRNAGVANYSPDSAPVVRRPKELQERTSPQVFHILSKVLNGQHTLRDLAMLMKQDVTAVTRSLLPYIRSGLVELVSLPDLPLQVDTRLPHTLAAIAAPTGPLVACVDDSPLICQTMEALLTAAGYRFVGVEDGLRAFSVMLAHKPDAIFLDLVMPNTNGYEICSRLRKLSFFHDTPIVILTGRDGIVDRVRAKLVGASDFLSKPVDAEKVLGVIRKHLVSH